MFYPDRLVSWMTSLVRRYSHRISYLCILCSTVAVRADVQSPGVCLLSCQLEIPKLFVNMPMTQLVTIINQTALNTTYTWGKVGGLFIQIIYMGQGGWSLYTTYIYGARWVVSILHILYTWGKVGGLYYYYLFAEWHVPHIVSTTDSPSFFPVGSVLSSSRSFSPGSQSSRCHLSRHEPRSGLRFSPASS